MNILHVIPYFHPAKRFGGAPEAVYDLVKAQVRLGHHVTVCTSDAGLYDAYTQCDFEFTWHSNAVYIAKGVSANLTIYYFPNRFLWFTEKYKYFTASYLHPQLVDYNRLDAIHLHEVHIPGYDYAAKLAEQYAIPLFLSPHGSLAPPVHSGIKKMLHHFGDNILRHKWFHKVHTYMSLCQNETQQFLQCGADADKIKQLPYGLPVIERDTAAIPCQIKKSKTLKTFLYLGRISKAKGMDTLCDALITLWHQQGYRFRFLFCGHDENYISVMIKKMERFDIPIFQSDIEDEAGVFFHPAIPRKSIPNLLQQIDVSVCPSPYESFGLVPIESLLCDTPIIVTTGYGFLDYVKLESDRVNMIPTNDAQALSTAMQDSLKNDLTKHNTHTTLTIPSWDEIAKKQITLYQSAQNK